MLKCRIARGWSFIRSAALALAIAGACFAQAAPTLDSPSELAQAIAKKARRAEKVGESAQAYIYYSEAAALQPRNRKYRARMDALQSRAVRQSQAQTESSKKADRPGAADVVLSPEDVFDNMTRREMAQARPLAAAPKLKPSAGAQDFDLNANARVLWISVAARFGLEAVFDRDYPQAGQPVRFRITEADYRDALHGLEAASSSFVIPVSSTIFMVASDTQQKRQDLEQTLTLAVPIPQSLSAQELTEIAQTVRQITDVQKIAWNTVDNQIVMRDRVSRVAVAQALLEQLIAWRPEALVDVEFVEVSDSDIANYGFNVSNQFSAIYLGHILNNVIAVPNGVTNLLTFGGGKTLIGLTAAQVQAMFNETINASRVLYQAQVRAQSGQSATFHVGERYPVVTAGYFGAVPQGLQNQVYAPIPSFTYEDLGVAMKITPHVHGMDDVTVGFEATVEVLTGQSNNGIPLIGSRKLKTDARVRNEEWSIVAGVSTSTSSRSVSGFWGLADLPLFGPFFKQTHTDKESGYVLIGIRPHLLSIPPDQMATRAIDWGSEARPVTPL